MSTLPFDYSTTRLAARATPIPYVNPAWLGPILGVTGFLSFLPYPALNIGNTSALQMGNVAALVLCLPLLFTRGFAASLRPCGAILLPLAISTFAIAVGRGEPGELLYCVKSFVGWVVSALTLALTIHFAPRYALPMLTGIAAAIVLHAIIGAAQFAAFTGGGELPLTELYVNHSFLSVQNEAVRIARYIQRPFGLFPEPSAMSSSITPFVILLAALTADLVRLPVVAPRPWQKLLFAAAAAGGTALVIVSRSGHLAFLMVGLAVVAAGWARRARVRQADVLVLAAGLLVVLPAVAWFASTSLGDRLGGKSDVGNSSWEERASSLQIGFDLLADAGLGAMTFGMGPGLSSIAIVRATGIDAVFSISLVYLYETGIVGALGGLWLACAIAERWLALRLDAIYGTALLAWVMGVTLTTSYSQLLPLWIALGWLLAWPVLHVDARPPVDARLAADARRGEVAR